MIIRRAKLTDAQRIVDLHRNTILQVNSKFYSSIQVKSWIKNVTVKNCRKEIKDDFVLVAIENDEIMGFSHFDKTGTIYEIYVASVFIGRGIGRALLRKAEQKLFDLGVKDITLNSTINALGFYGKHGYKQVKEIFFGREKIKMVVMKKKCNS